MNRCVQNPRPDYKGSHSIVLAKAFTVIPQCPLWFKVCRRIIETRPSLLYLLPGSTM